MVIQHNIPALNSHRNMGINSNNTAKNLEKLSSGFRINRAGDDAAGLAISEKMRGQIRGLAMAEQNTSNGISLIQTAEGGLNETHAILQRMRELAVQASNGTYQNEDREQIALEVNSLKSEIDRIASSTHYNQINLLDGTLGGRSVSEQGALAGAGFNPALAISVAAGAGGAAVANQRATLIVNRDNVGDITSMALQVGDQTFLHDGTNFVDKDGNAVASITAGLPQDAPLFSGGASVISNITLDAAGVAIDVVDDVNAFVGGTRSQLIFQIGANGGLDQRVGMNVGNMSTSALGNHVAAPNNGGGTIAGISIETRDQANAAIEVIDAAINQVSSQRASLGALQNRLEHTLNNLGVTKENLTAAESTIRDVDMAKEMMEFTKNNILVQASQAMLAQANQLPSGVLSLLR